MILFYVLIGNFKVETRRNKNKFFLLVNNKKENKWVNLVLYQFKRDKYKQICYSMKYNANGLTDEIDKELFAKISIYVEELAKNLCFLLEYEMK